MIIKKLVSIFIFFVVWTLPFVAIYKSLQTYGKMSFIDTNLANARNSINKEIVKKNLNAVLTGIENIGLKGNISIFSSESDEIDSIKTGINSILNVLSEEKGESVSADVQQRIRSLPETIAFSYCIWKIGVSFALIELFLVVVRILLVCSIKEDEQVLNLSLLNDLSQGRSGYDE